MNKKDFRIENPCKIVVSDYRITIAIPLKGKCSIATSLLSNDIYQAEQNFQKSYIGTKENSQTLLAIVRLAILYNAVSITDFDELTELYGKKVSEMIGTDIKVDEQENILEIDYKLEKNNN